MANVKEKAIRQEFQIQQRADLLSLHRALCEKEQIVVEAADAGQIGRVVILKERIVKLLKRCDM
jgi:hypothetical protein